eukprot:TRINITY_DN3695_c0_g2_i1.p1 TRINITY_DN3695_c0_g2~~TRINITY_DN3695_c0_g2_i1.p1  ORF type:complete len:650 (+),score=189.96 TRINITY_DN3695_c0_g2_i1:117-2066(+)
MKPTEEQYNDAASDYFVIILLSLVAIPSTYFFVRNRLQKPEEPHETDCQCSLCKDRAASASKKAAAPSSSAFSTSTIIKSAVLVLLWALLLAQVFYVVTKPESPEAAPVFDPYTILGLEMGAPEDQIKQAYRSLSKQYHPDRFPDPNDEEVQNRYIALVKAYQTLTDEVTRNNWEKYGNPDGPRAASVGIALPSWLVKKDNNAAVLGIYMIALIVLLPTGVGMWWKSFKSVDSSLVKVKQSTMRLFYQTVEEGAKLKILTEILGASEEYAAIPAREGDEQLERVSKLLPDKHAMKKTRRFNMPYAIKAHLLIYSQLCRLQSEIKANHQDDLNEVLKQARNLIGGMITISSMKNFPLPVVESLQLLQSLTQSCWKEQSLLQLPYMTDNIAFDANKKLHANDIQSFCLLPQPKRKEFLQANKLSEQQINDIEAVIAHMPTVMGLSYECVVHGEEADKIMTGAIITLNFTITRGGTDVDFKWNKDVTKKPKITEEKTQEVVDSVKEAEDLLAAQKARLKKIKEQQKDNELKKRYVHAPLFPEKREECWWVVVQDNKTNFGKLVGITKVGNVDSVYEGTLQFKAPEEEGTLGYTLWLVCDGYHGFDKKKDFKLRIQKDEEAERLRREEEQRKKRKQQKKQEEVSDSDSEEDDE